MSLEIRERHFPSFFEVPFAVYGDRYPFVPMLYGDLKSMLDPARNPLFQAAAGTYYTAMRAGHPVGRIVALVHHAANQRFAEKTACAAP